MVGNMAQDEQKLWSEEVRDRLIEWAAWTRGDQMVRGTKNVLADMIKKAAGEVPGADCSIGYELTFSVEVTDKAIARLKLEAANQSRTRKQYMKAAKRVLMSTYLGQRGAAELAVTMNCSVDHVKALLWYAESYVGRAIPEVEEMLHDREKGRILHGA